MLPTYFFNIINIYIISCVSPWPEAGLTLLELLPDIGISPNGRQSATLPEANRAEGNVGEARAISAPNPEGPQDSKGRNADWLVRRCNNSQPKTLFPIAPNARRARRDECIFKFNQYRLVHNNHIPKCFDLQIFP
jgi:hypothetical protein